MTIKLRGDRSGPPAGKSWRKINNGMTIEVAGLRHRKPSVAAFIRAANAAGSGYFGVEARREPRNWHSKYATAVDGWWNGMGLLTSARRRRTIHLGYLPEWASQECLLGKSPEPAIFVELYSCYLGYDGFVDVDIIVHVERTAEEVRELESQRAAKELRKLTLPGLKVLAHMAAMSGRPENPAEQAVMRQFVEARAAGLGLAVEPTDMDKIVEAAAGLAPSSNAVMAAVRGMASDDDALEAVFRAGIAMGRVDGVESPEEVAFLKKVLATAKRRRDKIASS